MKGSKPLLVALTAAALGLSACSSLMSLSELGKEEPKAPIMTNALPDNIKAAPTFFKSSSKMTPAEKIAQLKYWLLKRHLMALQYNTMAREFDTNTLGHYELPLRIEEPVITTNSLPKNPTLAGKTN